MKKKILAIGNYTDAMYHGFAGVDERLKQILSDYELICTDDTKSLLTAKENGFWGIISYLDIWNSKLSDDEAVALENFVTDGGGAQWNQHSKSARPFAVSRRKVPRPSSTRSHLL